MQYHAIISRLARTIVVLIQSFDRSAEAISECLRRFDLSLLTGSYQLERTVQLEPYLEVINLYNSYSSISILHPFEAPT